MAPVPLHLLCGPPPWHDTTHFLLHLTGATFDHTLYPNAEVSARLVRGDDTPLELEFQSLSALLRLARDATPAKVAGASSKH